jgi:CheY-like chemotaxis protein
MNADKPHLLVVDDEPLNRQLLRRLLSGDYEISDAEDADEALSLLQSEAGASIVLVLCDHLMPGKTGVELAKVAREQRSDLPFLLLTGYDQEREVVEAKRDGTIAEILGKPWRTRELRELIARFLR